MGSHATHPQSLRQHTSDLARLLFKRKLHIKCPPSSWGDGLQHHLHCRLRGHAIGLCELLHFTIVRGDENPVENIKASVLNWGGQTPGGKGGREGGLVATDGAPPYEDGFSGEQSVFPGPRGPQTLQTFVRVVLDLRLAEKTSLPRCLRNAVRLPKTPPSYPSPLHHPSDCTCCLDLLPTSTSWPLPRASENMNWTAVPQDRP